MPGLIQLINALNAYIRLAWAVVWFTMWGIFLYEFYLIVSKFLSYPTAVRISLGYKGRAFPMVTICNQNPLKYSIVKENKTYSQVNDVIEILKRLAVNDYQDLDDNPLNINQAATLAINQLTDEQRRYAGFSLDDFVLAWYFNNRKVDSSFFNEFIDPSYGLCYQFNSNQSLKTLYTQRAGSYFGLRALVLVNQRSPDGTLQYLPTTDRAGLKIGLNYQNQDPAMENYAVNVPVGTEAMVSLELTEINRAVAPYGDCVDDDTLNYYTGYNYTLTYCFRSCVQKRNIEACGCANPFVAADCGCNPSCGDTVFDVIMSVGRSPMSNFAVLSDMNQAYSCSTSTMFASTKECIAWFQKNSAVINIWYDGLDYSQQFEESSYSISTASNDLGGQAGLWVGISLISVTEIVVFVIFMVVYLCHGRKLTDHDITDVIREKERRFQVLRRLKEELDTQELMDDEIGVRFRAFKMRDELQRLARIKEGQELNEKAVQRAKQKQHQKSNEHSTSKELQTC
ncbi:unnamed protein product [Bursaphelenchus xylophilus]|uniref:(pine wood nematode) hypothetical protein n=1 Tax=Bursaphelenchus xylophilus TaxID=6326 RepID=A0A1I7SV63_BURXY|nr:unnamed protein product [Bursaphelenchus xylophilus]CAG9100953.1 unnamed protein product [Bursaphelenchus xylophilus]